MDHPLATEPSDLRRQDFLLLGLILLALAIFVALTWAQWPLLTADAARELYVPFQIKHGALIYRDFYYLYGPVAPYAWATLLHLFGEHLQVLYVASALHLATIVALLYAVSRQVLKPRASAAVVVLFLSHFALGRDLQGYMWPYAFAATFAVAWGLLLLLAVLRHFVTRRRRWLFVAGLAVGLSCVTKLEFGLAAVCLVGVYLCGARYAPLSVERPLLRWRDALWLGIPAVIVPAVVLLLLLSQMPWATVAESIWPTRLMALWNSGGVWQGTFATWRANVTWFAAVVTMLAAIAGHATWVVWARQRPWLLLLGAAVVLGLLGTALMNPSRLAFLLERGHQAWVGSSFLLLGSILAIVLVRGLQRRMWSTTEVAWALLALYGLLAAARTVLHGLNEYSGYQAPVALIAWVGLAAVWLPRALAPAASRGAVGVALAVLLVGIAGRHLADVYRLYAAPHVLVSGPYGAVWSPVDIGVPYADTMRHLRQGLQAGETFVAAPMEPSLYLMMGQDNPVKEDQIFFGYLTTPEEQFDFIRRLEQAHVRFFVLSNYQEHAIRFGVDYMPELGAWLRTECHQEAVYGQGSYRIRVYRTPFRR